MGFPTYDKPELADLLADDADLAAAQRAIVREKAIRDAMARTGEGRAVVVEMVDAMDAMDQEAVLDLAEGSPTTLEDALAWQTHPSRHQRSFRCRAAR